MYSYEQLTTSLNTANDIERKALANSPNDEMVIQHFSKYRQELIAIWFKDNIGGSYQDWLHGMKQAARYGNSQAAQAKLTILNEDW